VTVVCELVTDVRGMITHASPEAAALLAIEGRWLLHKPLANFVVERDRRRFRTLLLELEAGRDAGAAGFALDLRSGGEIDARLEGRRVEDSVKWQLTAEAGIAVAPGEPALLDDTPASRERQFERLVNRLPQGVIVVDRELRVVYANPAARRLVSHADMLRPGEKLPDLWPTFSLRELAASLFTREPAVGRHLIEPDDRTLGVEGLTAVHAPTATLIVEDVTEHERTSRAERRFVENAAHELRTPLAAITSIVEVLQEGAKDDPEARERFLSHLRVHTHRLSRLAKSLLLLARVQTGQAQPRLDLVPVRTLLLDVSAELEPAAGVGVDVRAPESAAVLADRDLLEQVVVNVATNAVKYTRDGEIVLEARELGQATEIEVRDTGTGMTPEQLAHAFDRFYRSQPHDTDGFGLGLAIAAEAVHVLGGTIDLESSPNAGSRVRVRLPSATLLR